MMSKKSNVRQSQYVVEIRTPIDRRAQPIRVKATRNRLLAENVISQGQLARTEGFPKQCDISLCLLLLYLLQGLVHLRK